MFRESPPFAVSTRRLTALLLLVLSTASVSAQTPCPQTTVRPLVPSSGDRFGHGLAVLGNELAVGSSIDRSISVFRREGMNWYLTDLIRSPGVGSGNLFGNALAHANMGSGDVLVSSSPMEPAPNRGRVHVFGKPGASWLHLDTLASSDDSPYARFGSCVGTDGTRIVASATGVPVVGTTPLSQGAAYVFESSPSGWSEVQVVTPADPGNGDQFGSALALLGNQLVVGAPLDDGPWPDEGSVYVFAHDGSGYAQAQKLQGSGLLQGSAFGSSLALDGTTLLVGAPGHSNGSNVEDGAVFVFELQGGAWQQTQVLTASDGRSADAFGTRLALEGNVALASAPERYDATGAVYVFERDASGWSERAILEPSHGEVQGHFGSALALLGDSIVTSAPDTREGGTVQTYSLSGSGCATISAFPDRVRITRGGTQVLTLDAGAAFAGQPYQLAATIHGTQPGFVAPNGQRVPLNPGPFLTLSLSNTSSYWTHGRGTLDANGQAAAWLNVPALNEISLAGLAVNHSFAAFGANGTVHHGNTTTLRIVQ